MQYTHFSKVGLLILSNHSLGVMNLKQTTRINVVAVLNTMIMFSFSSRFSDAENLQCQSPVRSNFILPPPVQIRGLQWFFCRQGQGLYYRRLPGASREMNKPDGVSACHQTKIETAAAFPADAPSLHHSAQCIHLSIHTSAVCPTCRIFERLAKNGVRGVFFKQIWYDKILILG